VPARPLRAPVPARVRSSRPSTRRPRALRALSCVGMAHMACARHRSARALTVSARSHRARHSARLFPRRPDACMVLASTAAAAAGCARRRCRRCRTRPCIVATHPAVRHASGSMSARLQARPDRAPHEAPSTTEGPDAASSRPPPPLGVAAAPAVGVAAGAPTAHIWPLLTPVVRSSFTTLVCMYVKTQ
jgi:hypothetical protein